MSKTMRWGCLLAVLALLVASWPSEASTSATNRRNIRNVPETPTNAHEALLDFTERVAQAYRADNPRAAFWELFYKIGVDDKASYEILIETIEKMALLEGPVVVLTEPLAPHEDLVERVDGYIYFQNIDPIGAINIASLRDRDRERVVRLYYGRYEGKFHLTCTIKKKDETITRTPSRDNWFFRRDRGQTRGPQDTNP